MQWSISMLIDEPDIYAMGYLYVNYMLIDEPDWCNGISTPIEESGR